MNVYLISLVSVITVLVLVWAFITLIRPKLDRHKRFADLLEHIADSHKNVGDMYIVKLAVALFEKIWVEDSLVWLQEPVLRHQYTHGVWKVRQRVVGTPTGESIARLLKLADKIHRQQDVVIARSEYEVYQIVEELKYQDIFDPLGILLFCCAHESIWKAVELPD
ncbi:MAG: hypothetical protein [Bacteriophage sp.]|nr:MAG: hypothetical protein [Bacteriophage sp.]